MKLSIILNRVGKILDINNDLKLWVLTNSEIEVVKSQFSFSLS